LPGCLLAAAVLLLSPMIWASGQMNATPSALPSGLAIEIKASSQSITVGDPIRLELDVSMPSGYQAENPILDKQLGDFVILEYAPEPAAQKPVTPGPQTHYRAHITAAAYRTGTLEFPAIQINVRPPDGKPVAIKSAPVKIEIRSVLSEKDRDIKDLKKQAEMHEPIRWGLWICVFLALGIITAIIWILWKRRRKRVPVVPAPPPQDLLDLAEAELRELLAHGMPGGTAAKPFYVRLSDIVKKMLEAGYSIHTSEQTTSEILDSLKSQPEQNPEEMEKIEAFLNRCDLVKFAKYIPSESEQDAAVKESWRILKACRDLVASRRALIVSDQPQGIKQMEAQ
jgi:hypothetical protein